MLSLFSADGYCWFYSNWYCFPLAFCPWLRYLPWFFYFSVDSISVRRVLQENNHVSCWKWILDYLIWMPGISIILIVCCVCSSVTDCENSCFTKVIASLVVKWFVVSFLEFVKVTFHFVFEVNLCVLSHYCTLDIHNIVRISSYALVNELPFLLSMYYLGLLHGWPIYLR